MSFGLLKWKLCINASRFHICFYLYIINILISSSYAVTLPDFTILADEQGNKVVNISSIVERPSNNNIPFQDERMQEFFERHTLMKLLDQSLRKSSQQGKTKE